MKCRRSGAGQLPFVTPAVHVHLLKVCVDSELREVPYQLLALGYLQMRT